MNLKDLNRTLSEAYAHRRASRYPTSHSHGYAGNRLAGKPESAWRLAWWNIQQCGVDKITQKPLVLSAMFLAIAAGGVCFVLSQGCTLIRN